MERMSRSGGGTVLESELLSSLSELVNRLNSHGFQTTHASRLQNDLGFSGNKVLYVLGTAGPSRPSSLAEQLATGRANVSKVLGQLEQQGLIERAPDPHDSRASLVALTAAGEQRATDVFRIGDQMLQEVMADWSSIEVTAFTGLMARFSEGVAAYERRIADALKQRGTTEPDTQADR
jgi:DNA-binding MarR family transcriptional regulator